jgi:hypothetical protein
LALGCRSPKNQKRPATCEEFVPEKNGDQPSASVNSGVETGTSKKTCSIQWEFQDPKMEVLYHIRPYFVGIFPYICLI